MLAVGELIPPRHLGNTSATAARAAALINLAGGWAALREWVNIDLLRIKPNERKK